MTLAPDDIPLSLMASVLTAYAEAGKALANYVAATKDSDQARAHQALDRAAHMLQTAHVLTRSEEQRIAHERRREVRIR